jgi:HD domain protein
MLKYKAICCKNNNRQYFNEEVNMNIDRDEAVDLLNKYVITEHIKTHSHAVEAVMRAPAKRLAPD